MSRGVCTQGNRCRPSDAGGLCTTLSRNANASAAGPRPTISAMHRLLLVESSPTLRRGMEKLLLRHGFNVRGGAGRRSRAGGPRARDSRAACAHGDRRLVDRAGRHLPGPHPAPAQARLPPRGPAGAGRRPGARERQPRHRAPLHPGAASAAPLRSAAPGARPARRRWPTKRGRMPSRPTPSRCCWSTTRAPAAPSTSVCCATTATRWWPASTPKPHSPRCRPSASTWR